jgi:hypothetical protein
MGPSLCCAADLGSVLSWDATWLERVVGKALHQHCHFPVFSRLGPADAGPQGPSRHPVAVSDCCRVGSTSFLVCRSGWGTIRFGLVQDGASSVSQGSPLMTAKACEAEFVLLMNKLGVPEHIANWRDYQDQECLSFSQLRLSRSGRTLLRMRRARLDALRPVGAVLLSVVIRILCGVPALHWVGPTVSALLFNSVTFGLVAAAVFVAKTKPSRLIPVCGWLACRIQILVTSAMLHSLAIFQEACRSFPRLTRAHYTQTKLRQRRVLQGRHKPINHNPKSNVRPGADAHTRLARAQSRPASKASCIA